MSNPEAPYAGNVTGTPLSNVLITCPEQALLFKFGVARSTAGGATANIPIRFANFQFTALYCADGPSNWVFSAANERSGRNRSNPARSHLGTDRLPLVVVLWKLLPCDAVDHGAGVCDDDLKFVPGMIDHEKGVNG